MRYGSFDMPCPKCGNDTKFRRIPTRKAYQCRKCYHQIYPCADTPFEKTRTPLNYSFYAMFLMIKTRNGVAAKELERQLGITYKTAFRMATQIRILMGSGAFGKKLSGYVEIDETYVGGRVENRTGRNNIDKAPVLGMVERLGEVRAIRVDNVNLKTINPLIQANIEKGSKISTDEFPLYTNLSKLGYEHGAIKHKLKRYRDGDITTNTIEGFFGQLKRMIGGTHIHVSTKYLQNYINEAMFRYNNRHKEIEMFGTLLLKLSFYRPSQALLLE